MVSQFLISKLSFFLVTSRVFVLNKQNIIEFRESTNSRKLKLKSIKVQKTQHFHFMRSTFGVIKSLHCSWKSAQCVRCILEPDRLKVWGWRDVNSHVRWPSRAPDLQVNRLTVAQKFLNHFLKSVFFGFWHFQIPLIHQLDRSNYRWDIYGN